MPYSIHNFQRIHSPLQWRHNERDDVSSHGLLSRLFMRRSKKISKLHVTSCPLWGNSPVTGEFPAQRASNAECFHLMTSSCVVPGIVTGITCAWGNYITCAWGNHVCCYMTEKQPWRTWIINCHWCAENCRIWPEQNVMIPYWWSPVLLPRVVITTTSGTTLDYINLASIHGLPWSMSSWMINLQRHWALNIHLCVIVINGPGNGLASVRPKPLPAPTRTYCQLDSYKQILIDVQKYL